MKKATFLIVLVAMFGWAIYDLVDQPKNTVSQNKDIEMDQKASADSEVNKEKATNEESNTVIIEKATIGLNEGNIAPDFQLQTLNGKVAKLSDYRGQRVMVNFWATWCPPCRAEIPDLEKFYQNKDVVILAVNLTQTENSMQEVKSFVDEFDMRFPILLDENIEVANLYAIRPIPTSYMIDSNGIIQFKALGALHYEMMVEEFEKMK
ncbi:redoxin domain-containing protein [Virgibacillus oceani]|uniref:Thiol:disulfide interchange protein tlpA n=1 Tax=Virgibacillus oceani TaxID=1479511 RepID=A0A917M444_9BACI|nr:redoxin domain-containing protein [Virgibacillus oceani]GGG75792.1 thiol:disulfide interchange protein tlpA [Virgibacillus oceani]